MRTILLVLSFLSIVSLHAQDPHRFDEEIDSLKQLPKPKAENLAVFTGSSSMRLWEGLAEDCQQYTVVNTGFGGSQMSDLLYFLDELVLRYQANKVFIYEGDNDINADKRPDSILITTKQVVAKIHKAQPDTQIYLISAKPSLSRWSLKAQYETFNDLLKNYSETDDRLTYIDVWDVMLNANGRPEPSIFIADSLHMNRLGYELWKKVICATPK
ncbi:MAG: G-D-S-L family lipolytic protein [Saprospiraceae bacterium]|nr:G-D-S-L family lipolytic protein [Saprospiraceae bacterium]